MTDRPCPSCAAPLSPAELYLCGRCLDRLHRDLDRLPDALEELDTQLARQAAVGNDGGTARSAERPLPYDRGASEAIDLLRSVLVGWVRDAIPEADWPADTLPAMARALRYHDWRTHPAADEFADELRYAIGGVTRCIDSPEPWRYLGPCGSVNLDGSVCQGDVKVIGTRAPRCQTCKATHQTDERMEWIWAIAEDQLVPASVAAGALSAWGSEIKPDLIRTWASRGRIVARGTDRQGRPVYRFGECRTLALEAVKRRRKKEA